MLKQLIMVLSSIIIGTIILAILSIVLASAWNNFINLLIDTYIPGVGTEVLYTFFYVMILTSIVIFAAAYFIPKFDSEYKNINLDNSSKGSRKNRELAHRIPEDRISEGRSAEEIIRDIT